MQVGFEKKYLFCLFISMLYKAIAEFLYIYIYSDKHIAYNFREN